MIATFDKAFFAARMGFGHSSEMPVFVVGMPRSGTTLTEQILASHPLIWGAGERNDFNEILKDMGFDALRSPNFPKSIRDVPAKSDSRRGQPLCREHRPWRPQCSAHRQQAAA